MASYGYTFSAGDTVTPTRLNSARTVSEIVNADVSATAAIAGTKIAPNFGSQNVVTTGTLSAGATTIAGTSGTAQLQAGTASNGFLQVNAFNSNPVYCVVGGSSATAGVFGTQTNIPTLFFTNNTERMRIDASGNVGIGTTSATAKLDARGDIVATNATNSVTLRGAEGCVEITRTNGDPYIDFKSSGAEDFDCRIQQVSNGLALSAGGDGSSTEQMRITSGGAVLIGTTSDVAAPSGSNDGIKLDGSNKAITASRDNAATLFLRRRNGDGNVVGFYRDATLVGAVSVTTTATAYNTSSDYRLKENPQPMVGALSRLANVKPVTFTWKSNGSQGEGFIAHELQSVVPEAVTGEKDAVNAEGQPQYQGVDASKLVPYLVAAVQELSARVAALEAAQ